MLRPRQAAVMEGGRDWGNLCCEGGGLKLLQLGGRGWEHLEGPEVWEEAWLTPGYISETG